MVTSELMTMGVDSCSTAPGTGMRSNRYSLLWLCFIWTGVLTFPGDRISGLTRFLFSIL